MQFVGVGLVADRAAVYCARFADGRCHHRDYALRVRSIGGECVGDRQFSVGRGFLGLRGVTSAWERAEFIFESDRESPKIKDK